MKKLLVVDDDSTLRLALVQYLEKQGYLVQSAESGVEALRQVEAQMPDLIVSDVMMPEMGGLEFCRQVRGLAKGHLVPFIFLSSRAEVEDRIEGHKMGADDYLVKPFNPRELVAKIEAQLERLRRVHSEMVALMQESAAQASRAVRAPATLPLTAAEERVFWEVVQGHTNKQIGDRLYISPRTVQTHLGRILSKLELENRSQIVRFAFEHGYKMPEEETADEAERSGKREVR